MFYFFFLYFFFLLQSSSLPRPYIGARRNRYFIKNNLKPSSLSSDYFYSIDPSPNLYLPFESEQKDFLTKAKTEHALQIQEEQPQVEYFSSTTSPEEQQLYREQEYQSKGFLSSSHCRFPINHHNSASLSSPSFINEQQHCYYPSYQYEPHLSWQLLNNEKNNTQHTILEKFEPFEQKQLSKNSTLTYNQNFNLSDIPEENSTFPLSSSCTDTIVENNHSDHQIYHPISTPILSSFTNSTSTKNNKIFHELLSNENNHNKQLPLTSDNIINHSSSVSTVDLITNIQNKMNISQLNKMSSLRYSSNIIGTDLILSYPYDQCITDQGNKYIIQLKTDEYQENEFVITPYSSFNQLIVDAKHREEDSNGGYIHRELHKIFVIPKYIDLNQYSYSYNKHKQELTIEMPYLKMNNDNRNDSTLIYDKTKLFNYSNRNINQVRRDNVVPMCLNSYNDSYNTNDIGTTANESNSSTIIPLPTYESSIESRKPFVFCQSAFQSPIVQMKSNNDCDDNGKKLSMSLDLSNYQAEDIKISIKDHELIVKAEKQIETDTHKSRTSFFQSTNLPLKTDIENLQSNYIDGKLIIEIPYDDQKNVNQTMTIINNNVNQRNNW